MSSIHVLQKAGINSYRIVVHAPVPAGNNSAGVAWADALKNSGLAVTSMTVGNGAGQISQNEANSVAAGTLIEAPFVWEDNLNWTNAERQADLALRAQQAVDQTIAEYSQILKFFGHTVNL